MLSQCISWAYYPSRPFIYRNVKKHKYTKELDFSAQLVPSLCTYGTRRPSIDRITVDISADTRSTCCAISRLLLSQYYRSIVVGRHAAAISTDIKSIYGLSVGRYVD